MARRLDVSLEEYEQYESGEHDIPISALYDMANILGIDFTVLITGEAPKMNTYSVTRSGEGPTWNVTPATPTRALPSTSSAAKWSRCSSCSPGRRARPSGHPWRTGV